MMRVALAQGVEPQRYALGAAAALVTLDQSALAVDQPAATWLVSLWQAASPDPAEQEAVLKLIDLGRRRLKRWLESGFEDLERVFQAD